MHAAYQMNGVHKCAVYYIWDLANGSPHAPICLDARRPAFQKHNADDDYMMMFMMGADDDDEWNGSLTSGAFPVCTPLAAI